MMNSMASLIKKAMFLLCLCGIRVEAQSRLYCTERLDSVIQHSMNVMSKIYFTYQGDSLVVERTYKAVEGDWQVSEIKQRHLDSAGRTVHLDITSMLEDGEEEQVDTHYTYDAQGREVEAVRRMKNNRQYEGKEKRVRVYDHDGNLLQSTIYDTYGEVQKPLSDITFTYTEGGKMLSRVEKMWKDGSWEVSGRKEWEYDAEGRKLCVREYVRKGSELPLRRKLEYEYDRKSQLVEAMYQWGKNVRKIRFLYDSAGCLVRELHYQLENEGKKQKRTKTVRYVYDGNASNPSIMGIDYIDNPYTLLDLDFLSHSDYKLQKKSTDYAYGEKAWIKYYYSSVME